jgi:hypothetical protein
LRENLGQRLQQTKLSWERSGLRGGRFDFTTLDVREASLIVKVSEHILNPLGAAPIATPRSSSALAIVVTASSKVMSTMRELTGKG